MNPVTALQNKLSVHLDWNKARCEFIAQFVLGLIKLRTSSLYRLRVAFVRDATPASSYKRIQRFFRSYSLDYSAIARLIVTLVPLESEWVLCLDRTNWKLGSQHINHLVLAVCCQGVAIPLFWCNLDKAGCSESDQRIALMKRFLITFSRTARCLPHRRPRVQRASLAKMADGTRNTIQGTHQEEYASHSTWEFFHIRTTAFSLTEMWHLGCNS